MRRTHARRQSAHRTRSPSTCRQQALALADRADAAVARGDALGPLHGVPVTIKENVDQEGCATVNGVEAFRDAIAPADSPVVANWKKAGAVIIGRTNTPAFSFRLDTVNDFRGRTYSPWSRAHTPGGSSGGASASVAAGITPLAHGNDIAGSVRYPAYCTGLAGLRPSFGRVPAFNPSAKAERTISAQLMSVQGALARTVRDVRLGFEAMAQADPRDPWWTPVPLAGRRSSGRSAWRSSIAAEDLGGVAPSRAGRGGAEAGGEGARRRGLRDRRREDAGLRARVRAVVRDADPGVPALHARRFRARRRRRHSHRDALRARQRSRERDAEAHLRALAERTRLIREWNLFLARTPLVLTPVCTQPPYAHGFDVESEERTMQVWREAATLMAVPVLGLPAMAVPDRRWPTGCRSACSSSGRAFART